MALDPRITSLRASGTYRFEFDKSQVVSIPASQTRLIVGFSKRGPFNTPVFIPDTAFFRQVFGDVDRNLERKESYFHRSCLTALERGPILALNLLSLDNDPDTGDKVNYIKLGTAATPDAQENIVGNELYQGFYNTDKFFFPDSDAFLNNVGADRNDFNSNSTNDLLNFVNLSQNPISIIVRKAANENVSSFNVRVEEWYGAANVPGFLHRDSLISDFMVDVFVIEGNFGGTFDTPTPYQRFEADPVFQQYFNKTHGIRRKRFTNDTTDTRLLEFFNESEVNLIASYTACLIPDFTDLIGNNLFIEKVINADTAITGLFCAVNKDLFTGDFLIDGVKGGIDLIGHNLEYQQTVSSQTSVNFLSYSGSIVSDLSYQTKGQNVSEVTIGTEVVQIQRLANNTFEYKVVSSGPGNPVYDAFKSMTANTATTVGSFILGAAGDKFIPITLKFEDQTSIRLRAPEDGFGITEADFLIDENDIIKYINPADFDFMYHEEISPSASAAIISSYGSALFDHFTNGTLTDGDEAVYKDTSDVEYTSFLVFNSITHDKIWYDGSWIDIIEPTNYSIPVIKVNPYEDSHYQNLTLRNQFSLDEGVFLNSELDGSGDPIEGDVGELIIQTLKGSLNRTIDIVADSITDPSLKPNQVLIAANSPAASDVIVGNYLVSVEGSSEDPNSRLTRINQIQRIDDNLLVTCQAEISVDIVDDIRKVELYRPIDSWFDHLNIFTLNGFKLLPNKHVPDGSNDRQNQILTNTLSGTNLYKALIDRENINFRYIVDTFGNGIETGSKSIFTRLCQDRKNSFAILNAPSAKNFKSSTDPIFTDLNGSVSARLISTGGDLSRNPTIRYSLPSTVQGGSWGAYYYPNITVRDLGKNINVPPAAFVSNNFVAKFENALPWSLVAGVRRGVIGGAGVIGLETNLTREDREYLEPFGINPIIFQSGTGPTIFANKTAQQVPKSALSSINVREVVIYIQDGIEAILKNYLFEFNTPQTRLEIKTLADNFLSTVQNDDGVFDFRNVMDETNNTPDVIDQNIGILDTYIEPVRGMEILVQRTTILRTGAISTGNFQ